MRLVFAGGLGSTHLQFGENMSYSKLLKITLFFYSSVALF